MAKLYIIPGHGHGDPGAGGGGHTEADLVRRLAQRIKDLAANAGDVQLHDFSRNAYAQGDLNRLSVPKGTMVLELHMDAGGGNARGAHVIIKDGFSADAFDNALANALAKIFPGRSSIVVGRSDLANVNRAARRGINYRLAEVGFIDNAADRTTFIDRMDEVARAILAAAGIAARGASSAPAPAPSTPAPSTSSGKLAVDGYWGTATTKKLQQTLNTVADGEVWGQYSGNRRYLPNCTSGWKWNANPSGSAVIRALQARIGVTADGIVGVNTVKAIQRRYSVGQDGVCGPKTVRALQTALNDNDL
ncbi:N-acetylmuramoyl-L-alanine amidase [Atopobiaceae bacterium 24-176]